MSQNDQLQYEGYIDILQILNELFKTRHNYIDGTYDLRTPGSDDISIEKLNEISKRLNLTLLWNYIRNVA